MKSTEEKALEIPMYFGDFGGILVPDSFTSDLFILAEDAKRIVQTDAFEAVFADILKDLPEIDIIGPVEREGTTLYTVRSHARFYVVAGHLALAKIKESRRVNIGAEYADIALFAARACDNLGLGCKIALSRDLSEDVALKDSLKQLGCELDDTSCSKHYNQPQPFAFQNYLGSRRDNSFIPCTTDLGPYPFPALSGLFAGLFGNAVREQLDDLQDAVAVTMRHGTAAVAAFRAFSDTPCKLVTIEESICQEYHGEYCGCDTLFVRTAKPAEFSVTLSPEIVNLWRLAKVARIGADNHYEAEEKEEYTSTEVLRTVHLLNQQMPEIKSLLVVEGENE